MNAIEILERFGAMGIVAGAAWWLLVKYLPDQQCRTRQMIERIVERFDAALREERELSRAKLQALERQTRVIAQLRDDVDKWRVPHSNGHVGVHVDNEDP